HGIAIEPADAWLSKEVEILVPAAIESVITKENVGQIKPTVKVVAEGANGPCTPQADEVFRKNNVFVIPDILCNAGGVTCSYFEQVQCNMNYFWTKEEVLGKLDVKMTSGYYEVSKLAARKKLFMRDAAYVIAVSRVVEACKARGWV
ncbi:glutamate dehydrogenase, partial [Myxococcota bacterium]|nr:glutamate dehydrogenase [Myxococcota bacterium]